MGTKLFHVSRYFKDFISRNSVQGLHPVSTREENLSLYRRSRTENSKECPNLPLNLLVEVTSKCNLSCRMCNIHHENRSGINIEAALLEKTFDLAQTAVAVNPYGLGEPLLHPDIADIVGKYKSLGASVGLTTNGMLLSEEVSRGLIVNGLDHLAISTDAADPLLFAEIRRGADLERISDNIMKLNHLKKSLQSGNPTLALSVVAQASNFYQFPQIIHLAEKWDVFYITVVPVTVHEHIPGIRGEALGPGLERWRETLEVCKDEAGARGISIDAQRLYYVLEGSLWEEVYRERTPCPEPFRFMGIRANGDIFPCCNWDIHKPVARIDISREISVSDLKEAWQSEGWQGLRKEVVSGEYPGECRNCMANFTRPLHDENLLE